MDVLKHKKASATAQPVTEPAAEIVVSSPTPVPVAAPETTLAPIDFDALSNTMPDVFGGFREQEETPDIWVSSNWIAFNEDRSKHRATCAAMGIPNGAPFLIVSGAILKWESPRMFLLKAKQFWTESNPQGKLIRAVETRPEKGSKTKLREHWEIVGLAIVAGKLVPFTGSMRSSKSTAAARMSQELLNVKSPQWATLSAAHRVASSLPPALRFVSSLSVSSGSNDNGPFYACTASPMPTPAEVMPLLSQVPEIGGDLTNVLDAYDKNLTRIHEMLSDR